MNLNDIQPVIGIINDQPMLHDLRAITYLATYPSICALGNIAGPIDMQRFHQFAAMVYGWMPRILRLNPQHTHDALNALVQAQAATAATLAGVPIVHIANCMHSVVGASKVLHFNNPEVFPIWDSNIERFRLHQEPPHNHMNNVQNYLDYAQEVHNIRQENDFQNFYAQFNAVLHVRLAAHGIPPYIVSEVRAIEAAAFELAQ